MNIEHFPDQPKDIDNLSGPFKKFYRDLKRKYPDLYTLVKETFVKIKEKESLDFLGSWVGSITGSKKKGGKSKKIWELRIPPTKHGGVVRLYFSYCKINPNTIIILSCEIKHTKHANKEKIKCAEKRYDELPKH